MKNPVPLMIENLSVQVGSKNLLNNISLRLEPKQFVSLMGENGSGKTTLLEVICGVRKPSRGKVLYWGQSFHDYDPTLLFSKLSWVTSSPESYPLGSSVGELLQFVSSLYPRWNHSLAHELCEDFNLSPKKKLSELSLGENSKVRLVKAISSEPEILLLDELTANLSPDSKTAVLSALMDVFSRTPMSVLYVCHSKEEAVRLSDRILELGPMGINEKR